MQQNIYFISLYYKIKYSKITKVNNEEDLRLPCLYELTNNKIRGRFIMFRVIDDCGLSLSIAAVVSTICVLYYYFPIFRHLHIVLTFSD